MNSTLPLTLVCLTTALTLSPVSDALSDETEATWRGQSITEFSEDDLKRSDWQITNDGVMGGLSDGQIEFQSGGTLRFFGDLSLENNGGFTTFDNGNVSLNLSNDLGLLLLVKGDGRTYQARLESDARFRGMPVSFSGEFTTTEGEWQQVKIPWSDFKGGWRGRDLPDETLNPAMIQQVGILLGDKKQGPFELEIDWIRTYGKGQGEFTEATSTDGAPATPSADSSGPKSLIETAVADGRFTILKKALDTAKLTTFFQWDNKLTVFAPTDEAFSKLPEGALENLLKPENQGQLAAILSYHVVAGQALLTDALEAGTVASVQNGPLQIAFSDGRVKVNEASLIDADVVCSDGVIHVIDSVLMPPAAARKTILTTAQEAGAFSTLIAAVEAAELSEVLAGDGPFTVFAPSDDAFAALPEGTVETLLKEENRDMLVGLLKRHVVAGALSAGDALNAGKIETLEGTPLHFGIRDGLLKVNMSTIRTAGVDGGNGTIHVIDSVILPGSSDAAAAACGAGAGATCCADKPDQT